MIVLGRHSCAGDLILPREPDGTYKYIRCTDCNYKAKWKYGDNINDYFRNTYFRNRTNQGNG